MSRVRATVRRRSHKPYRTAKAAVQADWRTGSRNARNSSPPPVA